jgi:hypothetical protein
MIERGRGRAVARGGGQECGGRRGDKGFRSL